MSHAMPCVRKSTDDRENDRPTHVNAVSANRFHLLSLFTVFAYRQAWGLSITFYSSCLVNIVYQYIVGYCLWRMCVTCSERRHGCFSCQYAMREWKFGKIRENEWMDTCGRVVHGVSIALILAFTTTPHTSNYVPNVKKHAEKCPQEFTKLTKIPWKLRWPRARIYQQRCSWSAHAIVAVAGKLNSHEFFFRSNNLFTSNS